MEEFEGFGLEDTPESEQGLELVGHSEKTIIYSMYMKLIQFEHHFDNITTKYKYMGLTWVLACYSGIGFLLSTEVNNISFNPLIGVIFACLIGMIGLSLAWHLDLNIYSKFWAVVFIEEVRMESKFDFLSHSRNIEYLVEEDRGRIVSGGLLYIISNSLLSLTIGAVLLYLTKDMSLIISIAVGLICLAFAFTVCFLMYKTTKKTQISFLNEVKKIRKNPGNQSSTQK